MYDRINDHVNNTVGEWIERREAYLNWCRMRRRYRRQERRIRFVRWCAGLHFYRIPETRWTLPISVCFAPSVGMGISSASGIVGLRWGRVMSIGPMIWHVPGGLKVRRWERRGFFAHSHSITEVVVMPVYRVKIVREVTETDVFSRDIEALNRSEAFKVGMRLASAANHDCPDDATKFGSTQCGEWSVCLVTNAEAK